MLRLIFHLSWGLRTSPSLGAAGGGACPAVQPQSAVGWALHAFDSFVCAHPLCRLEEHAASVFGPPDVDNSLLANGSDGASAETDVNDFPEPEIDAKRAEKDAELAKYVQVVNFVYFCSSTSK